MTTTKRATKRKVRKVEVAEHRLPLLQLLLRITKSRTKESNKRHKIRQHRKLRTIISHLRETRRKVKRTRKEEVMMKEKT